MAPLARLEVSKLKARNVPHALRVAVEEKLQSLEQMGVSTQVSTREFATPIVPVVKKDRFIRVCRDYKTTINQILDTEQQYSLPKLDKILAALARGKYFSKLDLNRAYQQVEMSEDSKRLLTSHTHKGLFAVNKLPFGVASCTCVVSAYYEYYSERTTRSRILPRKYSDHGSYR